MPLQHTTGRSGRTSTQPTKFGTEISVMEITRHKTQGRSDRKCRMERLRIVFEIVSMIMDIEIEPLDSIVFT